MKGNFRVFSLFILIATSLYGIGCATTSSSKSQEKEAVKIIAGYPNGYQNWTNTVSKVVLDKTSPFYGFQRVLVSNMALPTYKMGGQYPEGSRLVLEFNEPTLEGPEGDDIVKGHTNWIAVMTKDSSAIKTGGWVYEAYDDSPTIAATKKDMDVVARCYNCHTAMKHKDYIFSSLQ